MVRQRSPAKVTLSPRAPQANGILQGTEEKLKGELKQLDKAVHQASVGHHAGLIELLVAACGIYGSFLTWAVLQERITTTPYGPKATRFSYPIFLNTVQSTFAAISGYIYLTISTRKVARKPPVFPSRQILIPLVLVAITSSLASPFGYASLKHIDYITFILAKSCKLVPVMLLHVSIFRRKYPLYKYAVVAAVTAGVAVFTLHAPSKKKAKVRAEDASRLWGLFLLGINLLFDGLTNSVQDWIFGTFKPYSGPQMMVAMNVISTLLTGSYLVLAPFVGGTMFGQYVGMSSGTELRDGLDFVTKYPQVGWDVLGFSACGAIGQVFIYYTLANFESLVIVTITVTRKMLTMILSVIWFGHRLTNWQWVGVGFVFAGIGAEAAIGHREKSKKKAAAQQSQKKKL